MTPRPPEPTPQSGQCGQRRPDRPCQLQSRRPRVALSPRTGRRRPSPATLQQLLRDSTFPLARSTVSSGLPFAKLFASPLPRGWRSGGGGAEALVATVHLRGPVGGMPGAGGGDVRFAVVGAAPFREQRAAARLGRRVEIHRPRSRFRSARELITVLHVSFQDRRPRTPLAQTNTAGCHAAYHSRRLD